MPIDRAASCRGSTSTRTAYFCEPKTLTCATPLTIEMRCATLVCANSSSVGERQRLRPQTTKKIA